MKKTFYNYMYQLLFQMIKIAVPIVSIPIASKALGAGGIGLNSYTNSIVQYFVLVSSLGISLYGNREIARSKDHDNLTSTFFNIFFMKFITTFLCLVAYLFFVVFFTNEYKTIFFIQSIYILAVIFDISWFFMGIEDFKKTSLSSLFSQLLVFICIVLLIRKPSDIYIYAFILAIGNILGQIVPWFFLKENLGTISMNLLSRAEVMQHLKGTFKYFVPQVGIILYSTVNRTLLGLYSDIDSVGYYTNSMNLISSIITVITTIDLVMLPKMSNLLSKKNDMSAIDQYVKKSLSFEIFIAVPACIGIALTASNFVPWFFGNSFGELNRILPMESILLIIVPLGVSISRQYLIPMGNTKDYTISVLFGGCISVALAMITIPKIGVYGAIISNIIAELFVSCYRFIWAKFNTSLVIPMLNIYKIILSSIIMGIVVVLLNSLVANSVISFLILVSVAAIVYMLSCLILQVDEIKLLKELRKK